MEPGDPQDIANPIPIQPSIRRDHQLVLLPFLHLRQIHHPRRRRLLLPPITRYKLEVPHIRHHRIRNLVGPAHGPQIQPKITLRRGVHRAGHRQPAAVVLKRRNVLRHRPRNDHVEVFSIGPDSGHDPRPISRSAFSGQELGEVRVRPEEGGDGGADGRVGDVGGGERAAGDVGGEGAVVELEEADGAEEAGGEDGADAEDVEAVDEAGEHLGVHALAGVGAENGGGGARVVAVGVEGAAAEVVAVVVAGQDRAGREPARCLAFGFYEEEVEGFAFVQTGNVAVGAQFIIYYKCNFNKIAGKVYCFF